MAKNKHGAVQCDGWSITRDGFSLEGCVETCFTVSNGCFAVRGTTGELYEGETPGTYAAGVFDKGSAAVSELVNLPYPFGLRLYIDREPVDLRKCVVHEYRRQLDMRAGILRRTYRVTDDKGRTFRCMSSRLASMAMRNIGFESYLITCENFTGVLNAESFIDCNVYNAKDNPNDRTRHFIPKGETGGGLYVECSTSDGSYVVGIASEMSAARISGGRQIGAYARDFGGFLTQSIEVDVGKPGCAISMERYVSFCTSREVSGIEVKSRAKRYLSAAAAYGSSAFLSAHENEMARLWDMADVVIAGDPEADRGVRFCLYTLICCVNPADERVSIGARGLHGEGYKGHVFWDTELFMLPFFTYALPDFARALLSYRFHTLEGAMANAVLGGYKGARYSWESADTGLEETPRWGFNYKGQRVPILTGEMEFHISCDVAYAIYEYVRASGDTRFFRERGARMIIETARFWASRLEYNGELDRYELNGVIGPDEFHEGVNNNAFTNSLVQWNLLYAAECAAEMGNVEEAEIRHWIECAEKLYIPSKDGLIEQFEGYFQLEDRLVTEYDRNRMPLWPENVDTANLGKYKLIKQADVVMLLHLLSEQFSPEAARENYIYYENRTMHKSSLGPSMYALMGAKTGYHANAYANFHCAVMTDLLDNQGNTSQGIHAASAGGAWCALFYGFLGVGVSKSGQLTVNPWLPEKWESVRLNFHFQGRRLLLTAAGNGVRIERLSGPGGLTVIVNGVNTIV